MSRPRPKRPSREPQPAERIGSPRTEELVQLALAKLGPDLPPVRRIRLYAALLTASEAYARSQAEEAKHKYQEKCRRVAHLYTARQHPPEGIRQRHHAARKTMSQLLPLAVRARKTLAKFKLQWKAHEKDLPRYVRTEFPLAKVEQWHSDLRVLEDFLDAALEPELHLPQQPAPASGPTPHNVCLLWWASWLHERNRWRHMATLACAWGLASKRRSESEETEAPRPQAQPQAPRVFERIVRRLQERHSDTGLPSAEDFLLPEDRRLFRRVNMLPRRRK